MEWGEVAGVANEGETIHVHQYIQGAGFYTEGNDGFAILENHFRFLGNVSEGLSLTRSAK